MAFLRPAYYADSEMDFRVFAASLLWGFGGGFRMFQASLLWVNTAVAAITIGGWAKVIIPGGIRGGYVGGFIAEMEFRPIKGWPKRAHYGD